MNHKDSHSESFYEEDLHNHSYSNSEENHDAGHLNPFQDLEKNILPERDLWPDIEPRLKVSRFDWGWKEYTAAACLFFLIVPSLFIFYLNKETEKMKNSIYFSTSFIQMETEYLAVKDEILSQMYVELEEQKIAEEVKKQIFLIEKQQEEIKKYYFQYPDNMEILLYLNRSYQQGIHFLQYLTKIHS